MSIIKIQVETSQGAVREVSAGAGCTVLEAIQRGLGPEALEGACEGAVACTTCHVVLQEGEFEKFPPASEEEQDMLDLAYGLKPTSRLGCQLVLKPGMEDFKFSIPCRNRNN